MKLHPDWREDKDFSCKKCGAHARRNPTNLSEFGCAFCNSAVLTEKDFTKSQIHPPEAEQLLLIPA
ncbi:hypothetical protein KW798_03280 [Candidatus Parcubacteria bacterium]|nr:hypothetical protein [Candidatus Parcubacteria bacterium]